MRIKAKFLIISLFLMIFATPNFAKASTQIANHIDWNGFSVGQDNVGFSQSITPLAIPNLSDGNVDWTLNLGNSEGRISPYFRLTNGNNANFGLYDAPADTKFSNTENGVSCNLTNPNVFGNYSRFSAGCVTYVKIVKGETYTFNVRSKVSGLSVTLDAEIVVKSSGDVIKIGTIAFTTTQEILRSSVLLSGFNQTSLYTNGATCQNAPKADVIYSAPSSLLNGATPTLSGIRPSTTCPTLIPTKLADGAYLAPMGGATTSSTKDFTCPKIEDSGAVSQQPYVTGYTFTGTNQQFVRFQDGTKNPVEKAASLIGCYGDLSGISRYEDISWQYGAINRDAQGYYWINGAGVRWRLTLDSSGLSMTTGTDNPYYLYGNKFNLIGVTSSGINSKVASKPKAPTFKGFNVVGNTLNLNVNVGTGSNKPDKVYLIAPQLGIDVASNNTVGLINNGVATWAIPISASLLGAPLELKFLSVKNGVNSDNLITNINLPGVNSSKPTTGNKSVPLPAIKPSYKNGALLINLTARVQPKSGANPVGGYFVSSVLGFTDTNPLIGRINKGVISFSIPLSPTLAGKTVSGQVYLTNEVGDSKPLKVSIKFPGASVVPAPSSKVATVICKKGNQARTFVGKKCPPGWK